MNWNVINIISLSSTLINYIHIFLTIERITIFIIIFEGYENYL